MKKIYVRGIYQLIMTILCLIGVSILIAQMGAHGFNWWKLFAMVSLFTIWIKDFK